MIKTLYVKQCNTPLPYIHNLDLNELNNLCPYLTDCELAGAISSYLSSISNNTLLRKETFHNLEQSRNDLEKILRVVDDDAYEYFYNWYRLSQLVLEEMKTNPNL